jgi:hypothetical protein
MTRTVDVGASSRPQTAGAAPIRIRSPRRSGRLSSVLIALLLATALVSPTTVFAAGSTTKENGYGQTPTPKTGTSPVKEKSTATKATGPATSTSAPAAANESAPAKTLPFTGIDLRLMVVVGLLLIVAGASIVGVQRRQRLIAVQRHRRNITRR